MSFLAAYGVGGVVAALALVLESWTLGRVSFSRSSIAAYAFLGGMATAAARVALSTVLPARAAGLSAFAVALSLVWTNALYVVNVTVLAGEPYSSIKSLLFDALVMLPYGILVLLVARWRRLDDARERGRLPLSVVGLATLVWSAFTLSGLLLGETPRGRKAGDLALPDLVLVILDSARRDHLGFHGYRRPTSPKLDAWASRGRVYDTAFAASSWTVPTVASLLEVRRASGGPENVVDMLKRGGYATACFTDNPHLTRGSSLTAHFDLTRRSVGRWREPLRRTLLGEIVERVHSGTDEELADRALAWARGVGGPKFLYVHLMDSHTPYRQPPIDGKRRAGRRIEFPMVGMKITSEERDDIVARYDAGLRATSDQAARLLAGLEGLRRPFLAIVTADHGESLGEDGRWFHGTGLSPELLAIPLFAVGEGVTPGRVTATIGHSSIATTFLATAKVPCERCDGSDVRTSAGDPWVHGGQPPTLRYTVGLGHKLVLDGQAKTYRLYSLAEDPSERTDLAAARPGIARQLVEQLPPGLQLDAETIERIRALGYTGIGK